LRNWRNLNRTICRSRQCRDQRDKVVAPRPDFLVLALTYLVERVTTDIASWVASGDAFVVADAAYRPRRPEESLLGVSRSWLSGTTER